MSGMEPDYVTGRQLDAEVRAIEERMDRRHAELSGKIDLLAQSLNNYAGSVGADVKRLEGSIAAVDRDLKGNFATLNTKIDDAQSAMIADNKGNRRLIGWTFAGLIAAGIVAIWTTNAVVMQAIDLGKQIGAFIGK